MAFNFDSGQFNRESTPKRLGNWQVPRWAPTRARPLEMRPDPKPICDINGHFLPGAPRGTSRCFGHYTGTWDLPRKITRKVAEELAKEPPDGRFPDWLNLRVQRPKAAAGRLRAGKRGKAKLEDIKPAEEQTFDDQVRGKESLDKEPDELEDKNNKEDDPLELNTPKKPVDCDGHGPYIPGSKTDSDQRHDSYDLLVNDAIEQLHGPQENPTEEFWRKVDNKARKDNEIMKYAKKNGTPKLPYVNVSQNFQFAKKMHAGNLEHEPLPDTLGYRHMTKVGEHRESDIVVKPYAIGWKGYGATGPTCCTKMRVHRPKTCDPKKTEGEDDKHKQRPATSDLGSKHKKPLSLMDLAICWDFKTDNPKSEPRPPKHIDGSNGSLAPAVFTMVHTPKEDTHENILGHALPIFNQNRQGDDPGRHSVPHFEKDITKEKRKDSCDVQHCPQHSEENKIDKSRSSSRKSSAQSNKSICDGINGCGTLSDVSHNNMDRESRPNKNHTKEAWNTESNGKHSKYDINRNRHSLESYEKTSLAQGKLRQSSPNASENSRHPAKGSSKHSDSSNNNTKHKNCLSCNGAKITQEKRQKEDYKFAFKAGNPNSVQSNSSNNDSKDLKIPKMRHPYTKKSYTIPTLAPPFSIWRDANATGYPEHWRLASVYQHAYKPPDQRRKPLIESVYQ